MLNAKDCSSAVSLFVSDLTLTCSTSFVDEDLEISINMKTCRAKPAVTVGVTVNALNLYWEKTFENSVDIPISGFSVLGAGVYLRVTIQDKSSGNIYLKV